MAFKINWKAIGLNCFKPQSLQLDNKSQVSKPNPSTQRLSLSDISDPGSPSSAMDLSNSLVGSNLHIFTLMELRVITNGFSSSNFLGEGGFGPVYKGFIGDDARPGLEAQPVAVKSLDLGGGQGHREWLTEVIFLGQLSHPHIVKLIGYCCEDEHRLLVYEYMERGNLENQLFRRCSIPLPWLTRMKIALGAAKGLAFLHGEEKPVIYRDFKASNILLDSEYTSKLSDFGFAKDGPDENHTHVTTRVMGTHGYAAPEYVMTGHLTAMSDVYSFGVVLLELITGKLAMDKTRRNGERNLVEWARPMLKDPRKLDRLIDLRLEGQYSTEGAKKAAALACQCLKQNTRSRPTMRSVVKIVESILNLNDIPVGPFVYVVSAEVTKGDDEPRTDKQGENKEEKVIDKGENVAVKKENCVHRHKSNKLRRRKGSSAVYSDTALYRTLRDQQKSPQRKQ